MHLARGRNSVADQSRNFEDPNQQRTGGFVANNSTSNAEQTNNSVAMPQFGGVIDESSIMQASFAAGIPQQP